MSERLFEVGDEVTVFHGGRPVRFSRISRVMVRFVEITEGSKWCLSGSAYPRRNFENVFDAPHIEHTTPEHKERFERRKLSHFLATFDWGSCSTKFLREVLHMAKVDQGRRASSGEASVTAQRTRRHGKETQAASSSK